MADQYWAVPISGLEQGNLAYGAPIAQLPDTSGMVEIEVDADDGAQTDISYSWMDSPNGDENTVPLGAQLYVAFDTPADTVGLRTVRVKAVGYGVLVLTVDRGGSSPSSFRIFVGAPTRSEFWTAFVNATELV